MRQLALEAKIRPACLCTFQRPTEGRCRQGFCRRYRYWRGPELSAARHSQDGSEQNAVEKALRAAERSAAKAEHALKNLHKLPSARVPLKLPAPLKAVLSACTYLAAAFLIVASHALGKRLQIAFAAFLGVFMGTYSLQKGYVSPSGAVAAALVGTATQASSIRAPATLFAFFLSSSKLTKLKEELKSGTEDFKAGGQRDWKQVVCTGLIPTILAVIAALQVGFVDCPLCSATARLYTAAMGGFLGYFACCCGDTWASELGQLSQQTPRLITTFRPVRKGTNGGVTRLGLSASAAGGLLIGLTFWLAALVSPTLRSQPAAQQAAFQQWPLIALGVAAGLLGSLLDSLLGATVQFTGFNISTQKITSKKGPNITKIAGVSFLDNNGVNLVSSALTAAASSAVALKLF